MEEIVQIIVEFLLQLVIEVFADSLWRLLPEPGRIFIKALISVLAAFVVAWVSVHFVPEPFIKSEVLRIVYLILAPLIVGTVMAWIGRYFTNHEKPRGVLEHFLFAWLFAFTFALTRFVCTQ